MQELIGQAGLMKKEICVAMMTRPFSHNDGFGTKPEESFSRGPDELRIGVYRAPGNAIDDVGFEQDRFATNP